MPKTTVYGTFDVTEDDILSKYFHRINDNEYTAKTVFYLLLQKAFPGKLDDNPTTDHQAHKLLQQFLKAKSSNSPMNVIMVGDRLRIICRNPELGTEAAFLGHEEQKYSRSTGKFSDTSYFKSLSWPLYARTQLHSLLDLIRQEIEQNKSSKPSSPSKDMF